MVSLPLFKLVSLFVRQISKYGANHIKVQAHDHPRFRQVAMRYGQKMHQLNMRMHVALLRDVAAERRARERAEAPTVKTEQETLNEERAKERSDAKEKPKSIWRRKFRPLPESKAVELFADVVGDSFVLVVAVSLILYEFIRTRNKPDANAEKISELTMQLEDLVAREKERNDAETERNRRIESLELALTELRQPVSKRKRWYK